MLGLDKNSGKDCTECEDHRHGGCDEDTPPREPTPPRVVGAMRTRAVAHDDTMTHPRSRGEGLWARHQPRPSTLAGRSERQLRSRRPIFLWGSGGRPSRPPGACAMLVISAGWPARVA